MERIIAIAPFSPFFSRSENRGIKFITSSEIREMNYPVGRYVDKNLELIHMLINGLLSIEEFKGKHFNIICRGSSGVFIGAQFASRLPSCDLLYIPKEHERTHGAHGTYALNNLEPQVRENQINVIVDDLIASGATMRAIYKTMQEQSPDAKVDCVCVSGWSRHQYYGFTPKYVVCGGMSEPRENTEDK